MAFSGGPFVFRINDNGGGPNLLVQVCLERGWREYSDCGVLREDWNLWWRTSGFPINHYKQLRSWQFTNHIPKGSSICRKDNLARYLRCMRKVYGAIYDFSPLGYNLPLEYTKLVAECSRHRQNAESVVWICKPVSQSQGRGIFLFKKLSDLCYDSTAVVQRYIQNPLLIGGYKFDLRLYVCIPSYHPLTVYLYREGLARFGTDKFSLADLDNPFCHLTNSSLNKLGPGYTQQKERVGSGCKWTLKQLRHYFQQADISDWLLWQRVASLVVLTVLSQLTGIPNTANCFEFYGFDVLVDACLRPWLLEVNLSPALGNDCDVDAAVKKPMLHDMFDLLGLPVCNTGLSLFTIWSAAGRVRCDDSCENGGDGERGKAVRETPTSSASTSALTVVAAASRWKRRHQQSQQQLQQQQQQEQQQQYGVGVATSRVGQASTARPPTRKKSASRRPNNPSVAEQVPHGRKSRTARPAVGRSSTRSAENWGSSSSTHSCSPSTVGEDDCHSTRSSLYVNNHAVGDTWARYNPLLVDKSRSQNRGFRGRTKCPPPALWGNGRDWRTPPAKEGDWVRLYPLGHVTAVDETPGSPASVGDKEVKRVVAAVHKYSKMARELVRRHPALTDDAYNNFMQQALALTTSVWLPPK